MIELIITISLVLVVWAYWLTMRQDRSWVTVLAPVCLTFIPAYYVLELIHIHYFGYSGSVGAYAFCYLTYAINFVVLAAAYRWFPSWKLALPLQVEGRIRYLPYVLLGLSILVYLPILFEFRDLILSPREIYLRTRTGYGHMFFVSTTLTYLAFITMLFKHQAVKGEKVLFFVVCAALCLMHGSKGQVLQLLLIGLLYRVFVSGHRVSFGRAFRLVTVIVIGVGAMFYTLHSRMGDADDDGLLRAISTYSDYNRNTMMLIDDNPEPLYGRLTIEQNVYSRIPRVIYPDKPMDWGTFYLAKKYYPVWFEKETGAASFGLLGVPFADFGYLALIWIAWWAAVTGALLKIFMIRLRGSDSPADFIVILLLCGVSIVPGGFGYTLPEHLALAIGLAVMMRLRFRIVGSSRAEVARDQAVVHG